MTKSAGATHSITEKWAVEMTGTEDCHVVYKCMSTFDCDCKWCLSTYKVKRAAMLRSLLYSSPVIVLQYLQVQSGELLPLLSWVAFILLDGPGWLAALGIWQAGESQVGVQRAAFHMSLNGGGERVWWENLFDQVRLLWRFGWAVGLGQLVLALSLCLDVERRREQKSHQGRVTFSTLWAAASEKPSVVCFVLGQQWNY